MGKCIFFPEEIIAVLERDLNFVPHSAKNADTPIAIYSVDGKEYGSALSEKDRTTIPTSLQPGTIAIVKIGEKSIRVAIK